MVLVERMADLPENQDFLFKANFHRAYDHITDNNFSAVMVRNATNLPKTILRKTGMGYLTEMDDINALQVSEEAGDLAIH